jgi:hypothetical protein
MFSRLDDLMLLVGVGTIAAGIYLGVGLPLALIFIGAFLTWAGIRYQPPGASNE